MVLAEKMSVEENLARLRQQIFSDENKLRVKMEMRAAFFETGDHFFFLRDEDALNAFLEGHWAEVERMVREAARQENQAEIYVKMFKWNLERF